MRKHSTPARHGHVRWAGEQKRVGKGRQDSPVGPATAARLPVALLRRLGLRHRCDANMLRKEGTTKLRRYFRLSFVGASDPWELGDAAAAVAHFVCRQNAEGEKTVPDRIPRKLRALTPTRFYRNSKMEHKFKGLLRYESIFLANCKDNCLQLRHGVFEFIVLFSH